MPELPDVEGFRRTADDVAVGRTVTAITATDERVLRNTTPQGMGRALKGARVDAVQRHGKWLWLRTDQRCDLLLHFGMTGGLHPHTADEPACGHDRLVLALDDDTHLAVHMQRLLGGAWRVRSEAEAREITGALGPDALGLDGDDLQELLGGSRATLKSALMDQERLAGLGNELVDEVCWQVRRHPATGSADLTPSDWDDLAEALARVLDVGVDMGQVPRAEGFLNDAREDDEPHCPRCGTRLRRDTVAGRSTWLCPKEQPAP